MITYAVIVVLLIEALLLVLGLGLLLEAGLLRYRDADGEIRAAARDCSAHSAAIVVPSG